MWNVVSGSAWFQIVLFRRPEHLWVKIFYFIVYQSSNLYHILLVIAPGTFQRL